MAEAVVSATVEMLSDLLIQEASFLSGVRNQVQDLQAELQRMQYFLKDTDKRQHEDESVHNWVRSIRKLAYKTENVLETYAIKVESRKGKGIKKALKRFACLLDEGANLHKLGLEIGNIKTEIANLKTSWETFGIKLENVGESSNVARKSLLRQTFPHDIEEDFVGMQNDVKRLVSLLIDRGKDHRIISIHGMGGAGKTTLAKQVFHHKDVQNQFESFAWVSVSQQFKEDILLQQILGQLDPRRNKDYIKKMEYTELVRELCRTQTEKKCLVVLDDIWKTEDWTILKPALFPSNAVDCKVLLTTRKKEVAEIGIPHELKLFSEEEGWQLLKKKALTSANGRDSYLQAEQEKLGKQMVRECGYLPLAISVIGGILSKRETLGEWQMVNKNIYSFLRCGEGVEADNYRVMQILTLSYEDLPYQLKSCLLYLAYYPEDTEIDVRNLYWMWIAEGILSKDQGSNETLMEVGERYLTVLASRSLVQLQLDESSISSSYASCRLHDLIRDLCLRKCTEEDFLKVVDFRGRKQSIFDLNSLRGNAYRLVIYGSEEDDNIDGRILQETNESTRLYSLRYLGYLPIAYGVSKNLRNLRFLKVVIFEGLEFSNKKVLGKVIKRLIHLRFLSFENCVLDRVPSSIAKLPYLQTFHLRGAVKIPNIFWKLKRLIHLVLEGCSYCFESKLRLDCLSGLETLICDEVDVNDLSKLINLRVFASDVKDNESLSLIINCIEVNWHNIRDIRLEIQPGCDFSSTTDGSILLHKLFVCRSLQRLNIWDVRIRELPKYESGMLASSDLVELRLGSNFIEEDPMPTLEKLPKLRRLLLGFRSFEGEELICSSIGFPNLRELRLFNLPNLKKWRIDEEAMPNLSIVSIWGCLHLEMIPNGTKFLKALRELETYRMGVEFNDRIRVMNGEEGVDFHKVRHVPFISIRDERH